MPEKRVALVIGNTNYPDGIPVSGVAEAKAMQQALHDLGFAVTALPDGDLASTGSALADFKKQLAGATVAIFFWAGHGFQFQGKSFLQPIDASGDLASAVPLETVLRVLGQAPGAVKLAFFDVCRGTENLPPGALPGLANPEPVPGEILQCFAASPGQLAVSGADGALSPYAAALVQHIREAGLPVGDLLILVHDAVVAANSAQTPTLAGSLPLDRSGPRPRPFCLRPAVVVQATVNRADDGLVMVLNGEVVLNQSGQGSGPQPLTLKAGANSMTLLVFNQKTFHNGQSWERTEGWRYSLSLRDAAGTELTVPDCQGQSPCFADGEDIPFKDGPHHGGVFRVATANLFVDPQTAKFELLNVQAKLWVEEAPVWARDQDILFEAPIRSLPLAQIQVQGAAINALSLIQLIEQLSSGGIKPPDLDQIFVAVRGNRAFKPFVQVCTDSNHLNDRIADLNASLAAAFARDPKPFASFDAKLTACVQAVAAQQAPGTFQPGDIRVWTDLEDRSA